jgi:hypothetical protein
MAICVTPYRDRTRWPTVLTGAIADAPGETWMNVNVALTTGARGLMGSSSLAKLLEEKRGMRNLRNLPNLTEDQIVNWADLHKNRTGDWPTLLSGPIADAHGEIWANVNAALSQGGRGFPGGSSLTKLLEERRGVPTRLNRPLTEDQILAWVDLHKESTGNWPKVTSGFIAGTLGETWSGVDHALARGSRNLPGNSSLATLLAERRGIRNKQDLLPLTEEQILQWLDSHQQRTGKWATKQSGPICDSPGDTWANVNAALVQGLRGLPGGSSLARLLAERRSVRNKHNQAPLTYDKILIWADSHYERTGSWPKQKSGSITDVPGETWANIDAALCQGHRGLPGGCSLAQLLADHRMVRNHLDLPRLSMDQILTWADAFRQRTGQWPKVLSGAIEEAPGEKWANIDQALAKGLRGLPGGSSLARLIRSHCADSG